MNFIKCVKCGREEPAFDYAHLCGPVEVKQTVMNERIKELAEKAGMVIVNDEFSTYGKFAEKFAQLIVRECASMARVFQAHEYDFTGDLDLDQFMLKHFGVEE